MDHRDYVSERGSIYKKIRVEPGRTHASVTLTDPDTGDESEVRVPITFEICGLCDGKGKHVNPSIDAHGISRDEFDDDPDFEEAYHSGAYDVDCYECRGQRVVPVIQEENLDESTKALVKSVQEHLENEERYDREDAAERDMERRFGC